MPELRQYHIFISHAWKYNEEYYDLETMLNGSPNFNFQNFSVPKHDPAIDPETTVGKTRLKEILDEQIRPTSIVLVISGMYVAYKEWIQYEIDSALRMGKPIIGIIPWGQERIPSEVQSVAKKLIRWNTQSITDAIRDYALKKSS